MTIRRPRSPRPALRHVAFIDEMRAHPPDLAPHADPLACLLTLRLLDHWIARSTEVAEPASPVLAATRRSIDALETDPDLRDALDAIVRAIVALPMPDAQPVMPALAALGELLQRRGRAAAALDVHRTVARLIDPRVHLPLAFESLMRMGDGFAAHDEPRWADAAYAQAGLLATRRRDGDWVARVAAARAPFALTVETP